MVLASMEKCMHNFSMLIMKRTDNQNASDKLYYIVTRGNQLDQNRVLKIENYCFEIVESF